MAQINLLKPRQVWTLGVGFWSDGSNLYLRVTSKTARSWVFRYQHNGKVRQLGLGSIVERDIASAREIAATMREAVRDGLDPADLLKQRDPASMTFKLYAEELIAEKRKSFKSGKHLNQWDNTLADYAYEVIGHKRPSEVAREDIERILRPIWTTKPETASRLRSRIEAILDYAYVAEGIDRRNPATFKGFLEHRGFERRSRIAPVEHHPAAPYSAMYSIMRELEARTSTTALCLRFNILTWTRSTEARAATWDEIDADVTLWSIPPVRMKNNKLHEVPLVGEARTILNTMKKRRHPKSAYVFPGSNGGLLSDVGINKVLHKLPTVKRLDEEATLRLRANARTDPEKMATTHGVTVHGFRSTARSWAAAKTNFEPFVLELALAHINKDKVEAAYQRDTVLEKRVALMKAWDSFCNSSNVIMLSRAGATP